VGFARYSQDPTQGDWVTVDLDSGAETVTESPHKLRNYLNYAIGADDHGNVFADFAGTKVRMPNVTDLDWSLRLNGIIVSGQHGLTVMSLSDRRGTIWLDDGRGIEFDMTRGDHWGGYLTDRTDDGGFVFYRRTKGDFGTLDYFDGHGEHVRTESAPEDVFFTGSSPQKLLPYSVTRDGEVLIAVQDSTGVHIVGIKPKPPVA
jgi:hypothetical protein